MLLRERLVRFANRVFRTKNGIWVDSHVAPRTLNVLAVLTNEEGRRLILAHNLITDAGDLHYAQRIVSETLTNAFDRFYMSEGTWDTGHPAKTSTSNNLSSAVSGSEKATATGYPTRNDTDPNNTGAGVDIVTHKVAYTKSDFTATAIVAGVISNAGATFGGTGNATPLLSGWTISSFAKDANTTLDFFVNHTASGV